MTEEERDQLLADSESAMEKGELAQAEEFGRRVLLHDLDDLRALELVALSCEKQGRPKSAALLYGRIEQLKSTLDAALPSPPEERAEVSGLANETAKDLEREEIRVVIEQAAESPSNVGGPRLIGILGLLCLGVVLVLWILSSYDGKPL